MRGLMIRHMSGFWRETLFRRRPFTSELQAPVTGRQQMGGARGMFLFIMF